MPQVCDDMPNWSCQSECPKHKGAKVHGEKWTAKCHIFYPVDLSTVKQYLVDLFPDHAQSELPKPWVHPEYQVAYAIRSRGCVVLAPPRHKPTLADGITKAGRVMMCGTAWIARGVTTNWLKYQTPEACRARKVRLRCEAAELPYEVPVSLVYKIHSNKQTCLSVGKINNLFRQPHCKIPDTSGNLFAAS